MTAPIDGEDRVRLVPGGLQLGSEVVPLFSGAVHYFQLAPSAWRPALEALKSLGFRLVDTYVPWGVHETAPGELDLGERNPRLDIAGFLKLAGELGLYCIVRPGPHINAELTRFGIPERVVWDAECQARSAGGKPVVLPVPPLAFPVPSYASEAFHAEVAQWLSAIGAALAPLAWPRGPIVLLQIDNEGAMYFRDGVYDQDYHPDAIARYRRFLQERYGPVEALRRAHENPAATFSRLDPPRRFTAQSAAELAPHLDWAEFQEQLLADAFTRMSRTLAAAGLDMVPTSHNLPLSEGATPLDPARVGRAVDLIGLDYYHGASVPARWTIARRTSELATRSDARGHPPFACEIGAGFPPFFPPLTDADNAFTVLTALAYGLRGFNAYMLVERDRWVGAPIDPYGRRRPSASFWEKLVAALERTRFHELERAAPVNIVLPRSGRRLARVCHAFGPLSAALFQVAGGGAEEGCFEDDLGLGGPVVIETEHFVREVERALDQKGVAHATVGGDLIDYALERAKWVIVASNGGLEIEILRAVLGALDREQVVTLGPRAPERDASMQLLDEPPALVATSGVPALLELDRDAIRRAVDAAVERLALPTLSAEPEGVFATLHHDASGLPTVLFVINPTERDLVARVGAAGTEQAVDALSGERISAQSGKFELSVPLRSVRMLELRDYS
jgi:beta-galactosidase